MINNYLSSIPASDLLAQAETLVVMPYRGFCSYRAPGMADAGMGLFNGEDVNEVWSVGEPVSRGWSNNVHWSQTDNVIFAAHWLTKEDCLQIEGSVSDAYISILSLLKDKGFVYPFRFWNYLPNINIGDGDAEVYKRFCTGRLRAFDSMNIDESDFPSASALGHHGQGGVIYVLASNEKPQHFMNSQQINAYEYPREYGLSSPSFARATAVNLGGQPLLFISGTASILGHKTVAAGDLNRQLEVTADNIEYLLKNKNPAGVSLATLKVYIRHPEHYELAKQWLAERYPGIAILITHADICRADLLVEIECFCR